MGLCKRCSKVLRILARSTCLLDSICCTYSNWWCRVAGAWHIGKACCYLYDGHYDYSSYLHLLNTGVQGFPLGVPADHSYNFELAAMYVLVLAYFSVAGAGAYSVDEKVLGGELNLYEGLIAKVFSDDE